MNIYLMKKPKRINAVSVTLFLIVAGLAYLGWALGPIYWPVFQMTGVMRGVCNDAYREKDAEKLMERLVKESKRTKLRVTAENFTITREAFTPEELAAAKNDNLRKLLELRGKACIIDFHYEDDYLWPVIEKPQHFVFDRQIYTELEQVSWKKEDQLCTCVTVHASH